VLISIRRQIEDSEGAVARFKALLKAFLGVADVLPRTAVPATPEASKRWREALERALAPLKEDVPADVIGEVGRAAIGQIDEICRSNQAALDEFDALLKSVVDTTAVALSGFKGHGERRQSSLTKLADGFDALSRVEDVAELRRRLRDDVAQLRRSVEEMRRENEESVLQFASQISVFQQRLEQARKGSDIDRLTQLGSRRVAETYMQKIPKFDGPICVLLFDIEGFGEINNRYGALFGDKLLQALAHQLSEKFPEEGALFRWGADEFLVIAQGLLASRLELCRGICTSFANSNYTTFEGGLKQRVSARVALGGAQFVRGDNAEKLYGRARANLEQSRRGSRP
jgi:diguanylate cyclase (GGDEF)-like protein